MLKLELRYIVFLKREWVCYLKYNRYLVSGNYFKFYKFKMKFKLFSLKENMGFLGILKFYFIKVKLFLYFIKKLFVD